MLGVAAVVQEDAVTLWLDGIKAGDGMDIQRLWDRYFQRLVRLAGAKLPAHCRRSFDEEDVALSAFQSFCDRAGQGQFPKLSDRDDLWRLLATITVRKALDTMRHQTRQKRGGGNVLGESALLVGGKHEDNGDGLARSSAGSRPRRWPPSLRTTTADSWPSWKTRRSVPSRCEGWKAREPRRSPTR